MAKLIYSRLTSLDGYVEDADGAFGWAAPRSEEVHAFVNDLAASVGTYLYGRTMFETMVYWETVHDVAVAGRGLADVALADEGGCACHSIDRRWQTRSGSSTSVRRSRA